MSEAVFKDIITASAPTMALLTGGVYTFEELGRAGLVPSNTVCASAFTTSNGMTLLKPCLVIRVRTDIPTYDRSDSDTQETSYAGVVEFWLYQETAYDAINAASEQLRALFTRRAYDGLGLVRPLGNLPNLIAPEFRSLSLRRDDYRFSRVLRGS